MPIAAVNVNGDFQTWDNEISVERQIAASACRME
jgi:hypothetical protein